MLSSRTLLNMMMWVQLTRADMSEEASARRMSDHKSQRCIAYDSTFRSWTSKPDLFSGVLELQAMRLE